MKRTLSLLLSILLLLAAVSALAEDAPQYGYINTDTTCFVDASAKALTDGAAKKGTRVEVLSEIPDDNGSFTWYQVKIEDGGKVTFVHADDVDLVIAKKPLANKQVNAARPAGATVVQDLNAYPVLQASGLVEAPLDESKYSDIAVGDSGAAVKAVKSRLYALGYLSSVGNDKMTKEISSRIKEFQKANGLPQDGECTAHLQAVLFSDGAVGKKGAVNKDPLQFTKGSVKDNKNGGGTITFTVKNTSAAKIDAFNFRIRLYNTYGERFLLHSLSDEVTIKDELDALDQAEERSTLKKGDAVQLGLNMGQFYFAGCKIAITGYHTTDGETVRYHDDQLHWYGFGKGVAAGYADAEVTALADIEKEKADQWGLGVSGVYVDEELAKEYSVMAGCLITSMQPGSPLDQAGLQNNDVLLAVGDLRIFGAATLIRAAANVQSGDSVQVLFFRNGSVYVTTLTRPGDYDAI